MEKIRNLFEKVAAWTRENGVVIIPIICLPFVLVDLFNDFRLLGYPSSEYTPNKVIECVTTLKYNSAKFALVEEVDSYIKSVAPMSALDGYVVIEECLNNSIDICFVLAQGEQESHFGTTGLARKTNSVFNVYAFDGLTHETVSSKGKYAHPNYSVPSYITLLKSDYIVGGKTEYDLMEEGQYVNKHGARYASSETYERSLYEKFAKIKTTTKIDSLYQEVNKYKLFLGL